MFAHPTIFRYVSINFWAAHNHSSKVSAQNHGISLAQSQQYVVNATNPRSAFDNRIENRLHVRRRAANDAEHLGRGRLMLKSFAQFRVAIFELVKQADVLNGDNCLIGEGSSRARSVVSVNGFNDVAPAEK